MLKEIKHDDDDVHRKTNNVEPPENLVCAPTDQKQISEQIYLLL
jgi:hypothetical protein